MCEALSGLLPSQSVCLLPPVCPCAGHPGPLPPPLTQSFSNFCLAGFGYGNGLGAGVFPEAHLQPGAWGCWGGVGSTGLKGYS